MMLLTVNALGELACMYPVGMSRSPLRCLFFMHAAYTLPWQRVLSTTTRCDLSIPVGDSPWAGTTL